MKKYLLVDVDGTLIDSYPGIRKSFTTALSAYGFDIPGENFLKNLPGPPMRDSIKAAGVPTNQVEDVMAVYSKDQEDGRWLESTVFPGVEDLLARWRAEGYVLSTATSKSFSGATRALRHFDLLEYFDHLGTAEDNGGPRQHKTDVVAYALDLIGQDGPVDPSLAVLIGDRKHDALGAADHEVDSVLVSWGYGGEDELALATRVAESPAHLAELIDSM